MNSFFSVGEKYGTCFLPLLLLFEFSKKERDERELSDNPNISLRLSNFFYHPICI